MRIRTLPFLFAAAVVCSLSLPAAATPYFRLTIDSSPGDWVGAGQSYYYNDFSDWSVSAEEIPTQYLDGTNYVIVPNNSGFANIISFNIHQEITANYWRQWDLEFWTSNMGQPIGPGTYNGATNDTLTLGIPRIYISGNDTPNEAGRGCDHTFGSFTVTSDPILLASGNIDFSATFEQHCEQADAPPLFGSIAYYSGGLPPGTPVPEPSEALPLLAAFAGIVTAAYRRKRARQG